MLEWGCDGCRASSAGVARGGGWPSERPGRPCCFALRPCGENLALHKDILLFPALASLLRRKSSPDILPMEQNTSFSARSWIINQRTKRAFKRVYLSIVAHPKWKCLWWYIYENTIFMMIVGMNVYSSNKVQSFHFLPQRNTGNKTFFNHDAHVGIFFSAKDKARQLILLWKK